MATYKNAVRIIGGVYRHRLLTFAPQSCVRPTLNKTRETLFNWLGQSLDGKCCLDLFAGSGALGFEAVSRGACQVVMVEKNKAIVESLRANKKRLNAEAVEIFSGDASLYLSQCQIPFDVIFLDPPFNDDVLPALLRKIHRYLAPNGLVYIEATHLPNDMNAWHILKKGKSGETVYALLSRETFV